MRLVNLYLENFQGIKELSLDFNGRSMAIKGKNATGKTTIANAYSWLLTDKPINGEKGYTPKTRLGDGEAHHLDHSVEAEFEDDNGDGFVLKKVFREKWTKKRGQATEEFTGHVVDYYIDGVPVKMKDFNAFIEDFGHDPNTLQLLLNVEAFTNLKWQDRRVLLLDICGEVSDEEIIATSKQLEGLTDILKGPLGSRYTVEEYLTKAKAEMRKLNKEIDSGIPERIKEAEKAIPEGAGNIDKKKIDKEINELTKQHDALINKKNDVKNSNENDVKRKQLADVNERIDKARFEYKKSSANVTYEWENKKRELKNAVDEAQSKVDSAERSLRNAKADYEYSQGRRKALIEQWRQVKAQEWEGSETCPTCGQPLPEEMIEEARAKFNLNKSKELERINEMGKAVSADSLKEQKEFIKKLENEIKDYGSELILAKKKLTEYSEKPVKVIDFEETEEYQKLKEEYESITVSFDADEKIKNEVEAINKQIDDIMQQLDEKRQLAFQAEVWKKQTERIEELENDLRAKGKAYEDLQRGVYLCEEFTKAKVDYMDTAIGEVFKTVKFRMFETQINGGLKACCDVMVPDGKGTYVPYASANNAARIRAGLEIIKVLSNHFRVHVPVFIDNAEGVDHAIEEEGMQIISLLVERNGDEGQVIEL